MRYFVELQYNGSKYHGWQVQPNALTVQEVLTKTLSTLLKEELNIVGAGRTDTGVHASYYVAHFESKEISDLDALLFRWNRFLPKDIYIYNIQQVKDDTHARFSAIGRTYNYYLSLRKSPFNHDFFYKPPFVPDIALMNKAVEFLLKTSDFTSFSKLHTQVNNNICDVQMAVWTQEYDFLKFSIKANRFLRNMVRAIVGTLLEVGAKKITIDDFIKIIESKDRSKAGYSVPANALFLSNIEYPKELFKPTVENSNDFHIF